MFKPFVVAAALLSCSLVHAADFTGVYQDTRQPTLFYSVHQSGERVLIAQFFTVPMSGMQYTTSLGRVTPTRGDVWDLYSGSITNNTAQIAGEFNYGACYGRGTVIFDPSGSFATATVTSVEATALGLSQGVQCWRYPLNSSVRVVRVF